MGHPVCASSVPHGTDTIWLGSRFRMIVLERLRENPAFLLRALRDPALVGLALNRTYYELTSDTTYNPSGTDIFADEDWDNLILLDACRHDVYRDLTPFEGSVDVRESRGSTSHQFVRGNFSDSQLHDVVYVSGNRWYLHLQDELNCELHHYYDVDRDMADGFVPSPAAVTEAALDHHETYPNKRLLVHYMQPHYPYLGDDNDTLDLNRNGVREAVRSSSASWAEVRESYRANLRYVLESVERLVDGLEGKTVISSDHGEMLGDRLSPVPVRWVGHPSGIYQDELLQVPWQVVSEGPRRKIRSDPPTSDERTVSEATVEQTLQDLGYKT